ncbi:MAG: hypothetical protein M3Y54_04385 [Bacteroidota bacterium]|nr:hypothetical protein [Bacteroidota bacterium]
MKSATLFHHWLVPGLLLWGGLGAGLARAQAPAATGKAQLFAVVGAGKAAQFSLPQVRLADEAVAERINREIAAVVMSYATTPIDSTASLAKQLRLAAAQPCCLGGVRFQSLLNQGSLLSLKLTLVFNGNMYYERTRYLVFDLNTGQRVLLNSLVADSPAQLQQRLETAVSRRIGEFLADTTKRAPATLASIAGLYHWQAGKHRVDFGPANAPNTAPPVDLNEFALGPHALLLLYRVGVPSSTLADTPDEVYRIPYARLQAVGLLAELIKATAPPAGTR